jgi:hypothetical protein
VPAFSCYPFLPEGHPDRKPWTGGCANAYWWHSSEDTLDKADREIITLDTKMSATAILELCNADVLPLNFEAVALEITDYAAEFAEKATGHVDAQPFVTAAKDFAGAAHQLMLQMDKPLGSAGNKRLNDTLMKLSRQLVPLTYSKGGRFTHDPAEWSPIMRNTKNSTFSGLNQGLLLNELKGQELYGFAKAGVVRQLNRAVDILKEATKLCNETVSALLKQEGVGHP